MLVLQQIPPPRELSGPAKPETSRRFRRASLLSPRRIGKKQLLEFHLEFVEVPLALLAEAVGSEAQNALFSVVQMLDPCTHGARPRPSRDSRFTHDFAASATASIDAGVPTEMLLVSIDAARPATDIGDPLGRVETSP